MADSTKRCRRLGPAVVFEPLEPRLLLSADVGASPALDELAAGNNAFAFEMYQALRETEGNLFFSPLSISAALSMTYAGAAGQTARQMADTLHFTLPQEAHHAAFGELIGQLVAGDEGQGGGWPQSGDPFTLNIANSLWGQWNYPFLGRFLDTLNEHYGSPLRPMDFARDPEGSRGIINRWVSDETHEKIKDLLPEGAINSLTALVLVNAIYFNASWQYSFGRDVTRTFHLPGQDVDVEMMQQTNYLRYAAGEDYRAVELPYVGGDASMVILMPHEGQFEQFEQSLSADRVEGILEGLDRTRVRLTMPQFECRSKMGLKQTLSALGMPDAFDQRRADFSGMANQGPLDDLWIGDVIHEAWISVDQDGTEAAAATAVVMWATSCIDPVYVPPVELTVDRPFIYLIRDNATDTTLFAGRACDASAFQVVEPGEPQPVPGPGEPGRLPFPPTDIENPPRRVPLPDDDGPLRIIPVEAPRPQDDALAAAALMALEAADQVQMRPSSDSTPIALEVAFDGADVLVSPANDEPQGPAADCLTEPARPVEPLTCPAPEPAASPAWMHSPLDSQLDDGPALLSLTPGALLPLS